MGEKTTELVEMAASVAGHCQPCLRYHMQTARRLRIEKKDIWAVVALQLSKLGGLGKLIKRLPKESMVKGMARRHQALSDPVRHRVLLALSMAGLYPCILKQVTGLSGSKLS